jgi:hypothetical protein
MMPNAISTIFQLHRYKSNAWVWRMTCDRSVVFSRSSGFLHQCNWPPRYSWNIVENDVKHHQTSKQTHIYIYIYHAMTAFTDQYILPNIFFDISVISWRSVLLVEETGVPGENHRPVANLSHWETLSHNVVSSAPALSGIRTHNLKENIA